MAKEYTVQAVSEKIKNWSSQYGDFTTYFVKLSGEGDEAVQLNKKPDSPAPKEGDELYGDIQETEFGKKLKPQKKPFGNNTRTPESSDTQDNIARSVALKAAVDYWDAVLTHTKSDATSQAVLEIADDFLAWLQNTGSQSQVSHPPVETVETNEGKSPLARGQDESLDVPPEFR